MVNRKEKAIFLKTLVILYITFCVFPSLLRAQQNDSAIHQRLAWEKSEGAAGYEVTITRIASGRVLPRGGGAADRSPSVFSAATKEPFVEVSLSPGKYTLRVTAFDYLDRRGDSSTLDFEVLPARRPEIIAFSPASFMLNGGAPLELTLEGRGLSRDTVFSLVPGSVDSPGGGRSGAVQPDSVKVTPNGQSALLSFSPSSLRGTSYRITAENPGGLDAVAGPVVFGFIPERPWYFGVSYAPYLPFGGYLFTDFSGFHERGLALKGGYFPVILGSFAAGLELSGAYAALASRTPGIASAGIFTFQAAMALQAAFVPRRLYGFLRAGFGITTMDGFSYPAGYDEDGAPLRSTPAKLWVTGVSAGVGGALVLVRGFFIGADVDFGVLLDVIPVPFYARPALTLGYRYARVASASPGKS